MNFELINNSNHNVCITIENKTKVLPPLYRIPINITDSKQKFAVKCESGSRYHKGHYLLGIETVYSCENIKENDTLVITYEKTNPDRGVVYYERLFVWNNNKECRIESYDISQEKKIKSIFNKKRAFERVFWMPIFDIIFYYKLSVIVIGVSILLINLYDFKWAVAFFPAYYIFWVGLEFFTEKTADVIFKKAFKLDDDKTEFYRFFEKEYIEKYYSNPGSKSFANVK